MLLFGPIISMPMFFSRTPMKILLYNVEIILSLNCQLTFGAVCLFLDAMSEIIKPWYFGLDTYNQKGINYALKNQSYINSCK